MIRKPGAIDTTGIEPLKVEGPVATKASGISVVRHELLVPFGQVDSSLFRVGEQAAVPMFAGLAAHLLRSASLNPARPEDGAQLMGLIGHVVKQLTTIDDGLVSGMSEGDRWATGLAIARGLIALGDTVERFRSVAPRGMNVLLQRLINGCRSNLRELPLLPPILAAFGNIGGMNGLGALQMIGKLPDDKASLSFMSEALATNPHGPHKVLGLLQIAPSPGAIVSRMAGMYPGISVEREPEVERLLQTDLAFGNIDKQIVTLLRARGVKTDSIDAFFSSFAEVREGFRIGARGGDDMQRVNWIHTRIEVLHTLQVAEALGLGPERTLASVYGSLFSDSFKDKSVFSLLWHNRPGAEMVAPVVMGRNIDLSVPQNEATLEEAMKVANEHQITPAAFMAGPLSGAMNGVINGLPEEERPPMQVVLKEIDAHVREPLEAPQTPDGEIAFSKEALRLFEAIGLPGWATIQKNRDSGATIAAIAGDVWQYVSWEGIIKIAVDLRDPGSQSPFMRDPVISAAWLKRAAPALADPLIAKGTLGAIESSTNFSFVQGMKVVKDPKVIELMEGHRSEVLAKLDQDVLPEVDRRLREALGLKKGQPTPSIPYWNTPIASPGQLTEPERRSADLVKKTVEAVMAEIGVVPLDPFGQKGAAQ